CPSSVVVSPIRVKVAGRFQLRSMRVYQFQYSVQLYLHASVHAAKTNLRTRSCLLCATSSAVIMKRLRQNSGPTLSRYVCFVQPQQGFFTAKSREDQHNKCADLPCSPSLKSMMWKTVMLDKITGSHSTSREDSTYMPINTTPLTQCPAWKT